MISNRGLPMSSTTLSADAAGLVIRVVNAQVNLWIGPFCLASLPILAALAMGIDVYPPGSSSLNPATNFVASYLHSSFMSACITGCITGAITGVIAGKALGALRANGAVDGIANGQLTMSLASLVSSSFLSSSGCRSHSRSASNPGTPSSRRATTPRTRPWAADVGSGMAHSTSLISKPPVHPLAKLAASGDELQTAHLMASNHEAINERDGFGQMPLHCATISNHVNVVKVLLQGGANVEAKDELMGWTCVHHAASRGLTEMVKFLLDNGACVDTKDNEGWTALMHASKTGYLDVVRLLINYNADPLIESSELFDGHRVNALDLAARRGRVEVVQYLTTENLGLDSRRVTLRGERWVSGGLEGAVWAHLTSLERNKCHQVLDRDVRSPVDLWMIYPEILEAISSRASSTPSACP
ncbi:hypothetical protein AAMO2058_001189000 [Amorphochlora amoebiformis]